MRIDNRKSISRLVSGVALIPLAIAASPALAEEAQADQAPAEQTPATAGVANSGEIIVTAQRRAQLISKVPMSLTALDNSALETRQVTDMKDLQFAAPGIRAGQQQGVTRIFIRGIGLNSFSSGADPSIAFYSDGVYIGRPTAQASAFYDVERIEVLRGPQGALYGRNATGGAVNVISRSAEREFGGYLNLTAGNYELLEAEGAINAPLSADGDLRMRVAAHVIDRGGYGYDFGVDHDINDSKAQSVRGQLQYEDGTGLNLRLIGEYHHENDYNNYTMSFGAYPGYVLQGVEGTPDPMGEEGDLLQGIYINGLTQDTASALVGKTNIREGAAVTLNAMVPLGEGLSLNSISSFRSWDRYNASNSDGTSAGLGSTYYTENSQQFSQEAVLNFTSGPLSIIAGASYYHEKLSNYVLVPFIQVPTNYIQDGTLNIDAYAAYGQATLAVIPSVRVTVGGRYSSE
ncbi:MAG: TonB-dependent receptor plug domain-containing protein, partial [Pseudomonadota bacterium]